MSLSKLRIGTRGSPLALKQAHEVRNRLIELNGLSESEVKIETIKTSGDAIQDKTLREFGGKGLFTKEIETALLDEKIDLAVHSMKDMPTELPQNLEIPCILPRADVRDAFLSFCANSLADLPPGAVVGTSSLRRQAQVKKLRSDLKVVTIRGNVQTRLKKLEDKSVDATLLACAGLYRLGLELKITRKISTDHMLPAVAQGAIGVEVREDNLQVKKLILPLNDSESALAVAAERAFLERLDGSCHTPIAGLAEVEGERLRFRGQILQPDGSASYETEKTGSLNEALQIGRNAANELLELAGPEFLKAFR